jgi:hypothetical protein
MAEVEEYQNPAIEYPVESLRLPGEVEEVEKPPVKYMPDGGLYDHRDTRFGPVRGCT